MQTWVHAFTTWSLLASSASARVALAAYSPVLTLSDVWVWALAIVVIFVLLGVWRRRPSTRSGQPGIPQQSALHSTDDGVPGTLLQGHGVLQGRPLPGTDGAEALQRLQALLPRMRRTPYTSTLSSRRVKLHLKMHTEMTMDGVSANLGLQLQQALRPEYSILNMSLREGCISLTCDLLWNAPSGAPPGSPRAKPSMPVVLKAVLPVLQPLLEHKRTPPPDAHAATGELVHGQSYLLMQLGSQVAHIVWDAAGRTWAMRPSDGGQEVPVAADPCTGAQMLGPEARSAWGLGPTRQSLEQRAACTGDTVSKTSLLAAPFAIAPLAAAQLVIETSTSGLAIAPSTTYEPSGPKITKPNTEGDAAVGSVPAPAVATATVPGAERDLAASKRLQMRCQLKPAYRVAESPFSTVSDTYVNTSTSLVPRETEDAAPGSDVNGGSYDAQPVVGWQALSGQHAPTGPAASSPAALPRAPSLEVLARCQRGYVSTTVSRIDTAKRGATVLQVELDGAHVDSLRLRAPVGGASVGLLPLTLELWRGERWLGASPVLLQLPPTAAPALILPGWLLTWGQQRGWWGGDRQAAIQELRQLCDAACWAQAHAALEPVPHTAEASQLRQPGTELAPPPLFVDSFGSDEEVVSSYQEFVTDLLTWMDAVRQAAPHRGCNCSATAQRPAVEITRLSGQQLLDLGAALEHYAAANGLTHVAAMLSQQHRGLAKAGERSMKHGSGHSWRAMLQRTLADLCVSAGGCGCQSCERQYRSHASHQLASVQVISSLAFMSMGLAANITAIVGKQSLNNLAMAPWAVFHLAVCVHRWMSRRSRSQSSTTGPSAQAKCSWLVVGAYLCRVLVEVCMALGTLDVLDAAREQMIRGDWVIATTLLSFGEQMQASVFLPTKLFTWLATVEGLSAAVMCLRCGLHVAWMPLAVLLVVAPRLIQDMHLRRMLRARSAATAASAFDIDTGSKSTRTGGSEPQTSEGVQRLAPEQRQA